MFVGTSIASMVKNAINHVFNFVIVLSILVSRETLLIKDLLQYVIHMKDLSFQDILPLLYIPIQNMQNRNIFRR